MSGGYNYTLVNTAPSRLICKKCDLPCRNAYLSGCCGSSFCKTCVDNVKGSESLAGRACPSCRNKTFDIFKNKQTDREVNSLLVYCSNSGSGCQWKGAISIIETHRKSCLLELIHCDYHEIGCNQKIFRQNQKEHNKTNMENHLTLCISKLKNLEQLVFQLTVGDLKGYSRDSSNWHTKLRCLSMMTTTSDYHVCPVILQMTDFSEKKREEICWTSNSFYTHNNGYKMCILVDANGDGGGEATHMSVYNCLMKGPYDDDLSWPLKGRFEVRLLNQISDTEHYSDSITYKQETDDDAADRVTEGEKACGWGRSQYISNNDLYKYTVSCQYLKDDKVFFQIEYFS